MERRTLGILGATGSIGERRLILSISQRPFQIEYLTAGSNVERLIVLSKEFQPKYVAIADETKLSEFHTACPDIKIVSVEEAGAIPVDICMAAVVGTAGLKPTMNAIQNGNHVAFASKECLVAAGNIMMQVVKDSGAKLLPVDSEHNAIFQVFDGSNAKA